MKPTEFCEAMRLLDLTQAKLSRETGLHRVTLQRYAKGSLPVPLLLQRYLELRLQGQADNLPSTSAQEQMR